MTWLRKPLPSRLKVVVCPKGDDNGGCLLGCIALDGGYIPTAVGHGHQVPGTIVAELKLYGASQRSKRLQYVVRR